ncbi:hypothetical protein K502DRAFT_209651 [Neoconidiobolus thromboides FSU 785]|nr:hypothetical protein K502DRAFT_209651 [Neoconidiobolus thromboides FSU 785]
MLEKKIRKSLKLYLLIQLFYIIQDKLILNLLLYLSFDLNIENHKEEEEEEKKKDKVIERHASSPESMNTITPKLFIKKNCNQHNNQSSHLCDDFHLPEEHDVYFQYIINQKKTDIFNCEYLIEEIIDQTIHQSILNELNLLPPKPIRRNSSTSLFQWDNYSPQENLLNNNINFNNRNFINNVNNNSFLKEIQFQELKVKQQESNILLYLIFCLVIYNKKEDFKLGWLIRCGLCSVRYLRKRYLMKSLTSPINLKLLDKEKDNEIIQYWLNESQSTINSLSSSATSSPPPSPTTNVKSNDKTNVS